MGWWDDHTPKITINNMTIAQVSKAVKAETWWLKLTKLVAALITAILSVVCCIYFLQIWGRTKDIQTHCSQMLTYYNETAAVDYVDPVWCKNSTIYDYGFYYGEYTDDVAAANYKHLLLQCDVECWTRGSRWSIAFPILGFAFLLLTIQGLLLALGVFVFPSRLIGLLCQTCCKCYFYGALITVTIFRFNPMGSLASISTHGSSVKLQTLEGGTKQWLVSDETTYEQDGKLLFNLWLTAIIFAIPQCLLACYAAAPPTQDKLRKLGFNFNEELNEDGQQVVRAVL